ncbi:hypothetical protein HCY66_06980 [Acinetobacter radioresistens]|uniref:hypothetical protein n=1 Tax=Acinetobacter radioresistens TaxID=40216 RepID=UPI0020039B3C|nr:hypothetical protein [Acinetobacter radioresistens]MCK4089826.1 hypothetical protein [Acinetobacter radioresistens]
MIELDVTDSTINMNGVEYDFRGYKAELKFSGEIVKVVCLKTGKDCTKNFQDKYKAMIEPQEST